MFLDEKKAYNSLDQTQVIQTLRGCRLGKNLKRILERFWEGQAIAARDGGCYGRPFNTYKGVILGYSVSPTIFNIVVNVVLQATLIEVYGPQEAQCGLVWAVGYQDILFYDDNGRIVGRNPIWVQGTLTKLVRKNLWKTMLEGSNNLSASNTLYKLEAFCRVF